MNHTHDNDIAAFNYPTTMNDAQKRAMASIEQQQKERNERWRLNALFNGVYQLGCNAIMRPARRHQNDLIDRPPALIRFLQRLMRPAHRPELSFKMENGELPHGHLVAYDKVNGVCYYPFRCENPRMLTRPTVFSIQRIFSDAILDGYSPHYLEIGDKFYTQFAQISQQQFHREIKILEDRLNRGVEQSRNRLFDFTGMPVISSWSPNDLAFANYSRRRH